MSASSLCGRALLIQIRGISSDSFMQSPWVSEDLITNIGWLDKKHCFSKGNSQKSFTDALWRCSLRPKNIYRGFHVCNLCEMNQLEQPSFQVYGRKFRLGNGEIRLDRFSGGEFSAPTLIAHYVSGHQYLPPVEFCDLTEKRAASIPVIWGNTFNRLKILPPEEHYGLCVAFLMGVNAGDSNFSVAVEKTRAGQLLVRKKDWSNLLLLDDDVRRLCGDFIPGRWDLKWEAVGWARKYFSQYNWGNGVVKEESSLWASSVIERCVELGSRGSAVELGYSEDEFFHLIMVNP